jgi:hypothetical protein
MYIVYTVQHKALIYRTIIIHYRELTYKILNNSILKNERTKANEKEVKVGVATDQMGCG